jgi:hypothetical protein
MEENQERKSEERSGEGMLDQPPVDAALYRLAQHPLELYGNVGQIYHPGLTGQFSYLGATGIACESTTTAAGRRKPPPHSSNTLMPTEPRSEDLVYTLLYCHLQKYTFTRIKDVPETV